MLREHIHIDGMPLHIIDTAGLRDANDEVERIGIERAWQEIAQADRVLFMVDGTTTGAVDPAEIWPDFIERLPAKLPITVVRNKADVTGEALGISEVNGHHLFACRHVPATAWRCYVTTSSRAWASIPIWKAASSPAAVTCRPGRGGEPSAARQSPAAGRLAGELLAEELRLAQQALSEITGEFTSDDLLGRIFSSFCIGK